MILSRVTTPRGELVLRRVGEDFELVSNGQFLMDTRGGRSERRLVREALAARPAPRSVLIGGLGVGFSLLEAVEHQGLQKIVVVEIEQTVLDWHASYLGAITGRALADPRVQVVVADVHHHLAVSAGGYDVICLDVDNGPDWTVTEDNADLYRPAGLDLTVAALAPGGVLAVWSAIRSSTYEDLLRQRLGDVWTVQVDTRVARGEPDVIHLGRA